MSQERDELIVALGEIGKELALFSQKATHDSFNRLIDESLYNKFNATVAREHINNAWFTEDNIRESLKNISSWLTKNELNKWVENYAYTDKAKRVGVIMAGNIPLVGFHDLLSVLLSGNTAVVKMSSNDQQLLPVVLDLFAVFYPDISKRVEFSTDFKSIDAMIATGSNNSARYFEKYFGHLPTIIRKNRTSVAVLTGEESEEELIHLGDDIFSYFGLGCRNVSKVFVPAEYDFDPFFKAIYKYSDIVHHHKYANNYDYYKAIYLMNRESLLENGFLITRETNELFAPVAVLYKQFYQSKKEVSDFIKENENKLQVVLGRDFQPFGSSQQPTLTDYADGVDTMAFLNKVNQL